MALCNALAAKKEGRKSNKHREGFNNGDLVLEREFKKTSKTDPKWNGLRVFI
jgi:hypothetical protein